jgi:hypothetical protein
MGFNEIELYGGLAGVTFEVDNFEVGDGITISKTYTHLMSPMLAAFTPAQPGEPHPAPWKPVAGGSTGYDIIAQVHMPLAFSRKSWFGDRFATLWLVTALLRLKATPRVTMPAVSSTSFDNLKDIDGLTAQMWPVGTMPQRLLPPEALKVVSAADLAWLKKSYVSAGELMQKAEFNTAFRALDACFWASTEQLALVSLWGALEQLFSSNNAELTFRVSATIASYLYPPGKRRFDMFKKVKGLYGERSKAAHGAKDASNTALSGTYTILRSVVIHMIDQKHVPTRDELEGFIFGDGASTFHKSE